MKTKTISLSLAVLMSLQSISYAGTDRTVGVGEQAISTAKENLGILNRDILLLDRALEEAAKSITSDSTGSIPNGLAVTAAGLGLGFSVMAVLTLRKGGEGGAFYNASFLGLFSAIASVGSFASGLTSQILKSQVDTKAIEAQLAEAEKNVQALRSQAEVNNDVLKTLSQLELSIKATQESLKGYQEENGTVSKNRLVSQVTQLVGVSLLVYGITQAEAKSIALGTLTMNVGNLGSVLSGFQGSNNKEVLKEIQQTRESLRAASLSLQPK